MAFPAADIVLRVSMGTRRFAFNLAIIAALLASSSVSPPLGGRQLLLLLLLSARIPRRGARVKAFVTKLRWRLVHTRWRVSLRSLSVCDHLTREKGLQLLPWRLLGEEARFALYSHTWWMLDGEMAKQLIDAPHFKYNQHLLHQF